MEKKEGTGKKNNGKILIGYDLGDDFAQISYCSLGEEEPETLATVTGTEQYNIPAVLCKRNEVNQWFYGKEAVKQAEEGVGIKVGNLVTLAKIGEPVVVGEDSFDPIALLTLFVKRSMSMLALIVPEDYIAGIMFTSDKLDKRMVEVFSLMAENLHLKTDRIFFQSHVESFYYFMLNQPKELWTYEVLLCDYDSKRMKILELNSNKKTTPVVFYIDIDEYPEMEKNADTRKQDLDMQFLAVLKEKCREKTVSGVYLIGEGYKEEWAEESLKYLCMGRRVFMGNNLYSKGACYGIREKLGIGSEREYVFLGLDKLKSNIGMRVQRRGADSYFAVLDAGINWFEAKKEYDVILEEGDEIAFILTPLNGREPREVKMLLEGIPERPRCTTRLKIEADMPAQTQIRIKVRDRGFGELFPSSEGEWIKLFEI